MNGRDAGTREMLETEYEILYCVRDLMHLYEKQLVSLYGKPTRHVSDLLEETENRISDLERILSEDEGAP
ncbi:MAG: hypothetical protein MJZ38_00750 [archaeon]|nr:hypothetical protein [archaeon]